MKKALFIAALVTLTACSSEAPTSPFFPSYSTDTTCVDTCNVDSLIDSVEAHADTLHSLLKK